MHHSIASSDFSKSTLRRLSNKGILVTGIQMVPDMTSSMPWANATKCYVVANNGQGQVKSFTEVLALA
jgi:hypothetical protein